MPKVNDNQTYHSTTMVLTDMEIAAVAVLADMNYEGNRSIAVRNMIRHYVRCQFPLMGLSPEIEQPTVELAK